MDENDVFRLGDVRGESALREEADSGRGCKGSAKHAAGHRLHIASFLAVLADRSCQQAATAGVGVRFEVQHDCRPAGYWPIQSATNDIKASVGVVTANFYSMREHRLAADQLRSTCPVSSSTLHVVNPSFST
jgi:hypothetical protein